MDKVKPKHNYIFGDLLGNVMSKLDLRVQLEASMMSMTLIICGLIISTFYFAIYIQFPLWYKITLVINLLAGMIFISSNLVTTYQQYKNYMQVVEFNKQYKEEADNEKTTTKTLIISKENI